MKYDLNLINDYIDKGLLEVQSHPTYPLKIYNYSRECAFEKKWDEITLAMRGTILDEEGNVIAKGFDKFFNMEELTSIPNEPFEVFEKMDGSLGILFYYNSEWILCTRGSFTSEQAIKGMEIFKQKYDLKELGIMYTYLFEIIYPENRIVIDYNGEEKLTLLSIYNILSESEISYDGLQSHSKQIGCDVVEKIPFLIHPSNSTFKALKETVENNHEGFIIKFKSGLRMKIKGEDYVRLHRLMTNFSNVDIWEALRAGDDIGKLLENVPDEFDEWVRNTIRHLKFQYMVIDECANKLFYGEHENAYEIFNGDKKKFAMWVIGLEKYIQPILFSIWDKKDYSSIIWKYIKPKYQKPFFQQKTEVE